MAAQWPHGGIGRKDQKPGVDRIGFFRYNKKKLETKLETVCLIPAMKEGPLRAFHGNRFTEAPLKSGTGRI